MPLHAQYQIANDQHTHEESSFNSGSPKENSIVQCIGPYRSSDVALYIAHGHADADDGAPSVTDTATVNRVKTFEFRCGPLELSSPHYVLSGTYRVHMHQS